MRLFRFLLPLALAASPVNAQTVQPTYTRPSKGASLTVVNQAIWGGSGAIQPPQSAVFDWTAFSGVAFSFSRPSNLCATTLRVQVLGANAAAGPFSTIIDAPASEYDAYENGTSWYTSVTSPYVKFAFYVYPNDVNPNLCTDVVQLKATPIPFDYATRPSVVVGQSSTPGVTSTFAAINYLGSSTTGNGGRRYLRLQNIGTTPIACSIAGFSQPSIILAAGAAPQDGTGGVAQLETFSGTLRCKCIGVGCTGELGTTSW